jgi:hypothetical protein
MWNLIYPIIWDLGGSEMPIEGKAMLPNWGNLTTCFEFWRFMLQENIVCVKYFKSFYIDKNVIKNVNECLSNMHIKDDDDDVANHNMFS